MLKTLIASAFVVAAARGDTFPSPLSPVDPSEAGPVQRLVLDDVRAAEINASQAFVLERFPLGPGREISLALRRAEVFAPGAVIQVTSDTGIESISPPQDPVFVGTIVGVEGSIVAMSFSPELVAGLIDFDGETWVLSAGPGGNSLDPVIYRIDALPEGWLHLAEFTCAADGLPFDPPIDDGQQNPAVNPCRMVDLAFETDREFLNNLFGNNQSAAAAYVQLLTAALTEIYTREINLRFRISFLNLWTGSDPWNQNNTSGQLSQFQTWWQSNRGDVDRDLAHFLSGRSLGGGVAYLSATCGGNGYAVSANLGGSFPYPLRDNSNQNWDIMVTAHELGHNLGTPHTHDYSPQIDGCGTNDCTLAAEGTIMSYCHLCPGGLSNIALIHPDRVRSAISLYLALLQACDLSFVDNPVFAEQPQGGQVCLGAPVTLRATVVGNGLNYSWRRNGLLVPGANSPVLEIASFAPTDAGVYQLRAGSACGVTFSDAVVLTSQLTADCNGNGICDSVDIATGASDDDDGDGIPDECACPADLSGSSDPNSPAYGAHDGNVDAADFFYFLDQFSAGNLAVADLSGSADPNDPAYGSSDGAVDSSDFFYFMDLFVAGCP